MDKLFVGLDKIIDKDYKINMSAENLIKINESSEGAKCKYVEIKTLGKTFSFSLDRKCAPKRFDFLATQENSNWNKATDAIIITYDRNEDILYVFIIELKSDRPSMKQIPYGKIHFKLILDLLLEEE